MTRPEERHDAVGWVENDSAEQCVLCAEHTSHLDSMLLFDYRSLAPMAQPKTCGRRRNMSIGWKSQEPIATSIYLQIHTVGVHIAQWLACWLICEFWFCNFLSYAL